MTERPSPEQVDTISTPTRRTRSRVRGYGTLTATLASVLALGATVSCASEPQDRGTFVSVSATGPDTRSGITFEPGQTYVIAIAGGEINTNKHDPDSPPVGPMGNDPRLQGNELCKKVPQLPTGAVGLIVDAPGDQDPVYAVKNGGKITPEVSGEGVFFVNDPETPTADCETGREDNSEGVNVIVFKQQLLPANTNPDKVPELRPVA